MVLTKRGVKSVQHASLSALKVLSVKGMCGAAVVGRCEQHLSLAGRDTSLLSIWHYVVSQYFGFK